MITELLKILQTNTRAELAAYLGICDTNVISKWASRGKVPLKYQKAIIELWQKMQQLGQYQIIKKNI
jgi:hypothetical protein